MNDTPHRIGDDDHEGIFHVRELGLRAQRIADLAQKIAQQAQRLAKENPTAEAREEGLSILQTRAEGLASELCLLNVSAQSSFLEADSLDETEQRPGMKDTPMRSITDLSECRARLARAMAELAETRRELRNARPVSGRTIPLPSASNASLNEFHAEIALLSDLVASGQDRISELETQNKWLREAGCFLLERGKWWWRFMPISWQKRKRDRRLSARNLFDSLTYVGRYPDVASSGQDPFRHFIHHGIIENRRYN